MRGEEGLRQGGVRNSGPLPSRKPGTLCPHLFEVPLQRPPHRRSLLTERRQQGGRGVEVVAGGERCRVQIRKPAAFQQLVQHRGGQDVGHIEASRQLLGQGRFAWRCVGGGHRELVAVKESRRLVVVVV